MKDRDTYHTHIRGSIGLYSGADEPLHMGHMLGLEKNGHKNQINK
jgi:hypothetical protein